MAVAGQSARHAEPSHEYPVEQANVQSPGVSEKCQFPETDWEDALASAWAISVPGAFPPQTSGTQLVQEGTCPETQFATSPSIESAPIEQVATAEKVPLGTFFVTGAEVPD